MRLLHVTDFHFREPWFHWLTAQSPNYEGCCFTGDLLNMFPGGQIGLRSQARWVRDWLREFPGQLYVCTGNHDWWPSDDRVVDNDADGGWLRKTARSGLVLDGETACCDGYRFTCCPWAHTPAVETMMPSVVLVHAPPLATPVSSEMGSEVGDPDVAATVGKLAPGSLVLSGHVHQPRRWHARVGPAWCFNPGVDFSRDVPNHIVIDTVSKEATFRGFGREIGPLRWADAD
jgi:Icc-related predicted phosphoesterase